VRRICPLAEEATVAALVESVGLEVLVEWAVLAALVASEALEVLVEWVVLGAIACPLCRLVAPGATGNTTHNIAVELPIATGRQRIGLGARRAAIRYRIVKLAPDNSLAARVAIWPVPATAALERA
jgi:hypothetical protein